MGKVGRYDKLEKFEAQIIDMGCSRVSDLENFPYRMEEDFIRAIDRGDVSLEYNYNYDFFRKVCTRKQGIIHAIWLSMPYLVLFGNIVLARVSGESILYWGCLFGIVGKLLSSPQFPLRGLIIVSGLILLVVSFSYFEWTWTLNIASLLLSFIFSSAARIHYKFVAQLSWLGFEPILCFALANQCIAIRNNENGRIIHVKYNPRAPR